MSHEAGDIPPHEPLTPNGKTPKKNWWWSHGPTANLISTAGVVVAIIAIVSSSIASNKVNSVVGEEAIYKGNTYITNKYASSDGAPGQSVLATPQSCGTKNSSVMGGWGPDRPSFTMDYPPDYTTIDAIRDNPDIGDERGLMRVRDMTTNDNFSYSVSVEPGHLYQVEIYVNNAVAPDGAPSLASNDTNVSVGLPTCTGERIASNATIRSLDAFPSEIWGGITFTSTQQFNLAYVPDSTVVINNHWPSGLKISGNQLLTSTGLSYGYDKLDGALLPGYQYAGYIEFEVRPQFAAG